jgi:hypothetical protein
MAADTAAGGDPVCDHSRSGGNPLPPAAAKRGVPPPCPVQGSTSREMVTTMLRLLVFGGVILLTVGAEALSWKHLTHIAATNGHIAPRHLLFLFPTIVDGFMVLSSGVVACW